MARPFVGPLVLIAALSGVVTQVHAQSGDPVNGFRASLNQVPPDRGPSASAASFRIPLEDRASYDQVRRRLDDARVEREARRKFLAKPEMHKERLARRDSFRGQSRAEARQTLLVEHGARLDGLEWVVTKLHRDRAIDEYLSDHVARVRVGGRRQLIDSMFPLRVEDGRGAKRSVDLGLEPVGEGFAPATPLVPLELPADLASGISVGRGAGQVRLIPTGGTAAAAPVKLGDQSALYANAAPDADFIVAAIPVGVETFMQLRSPEAPEEIRLRVASDSGAIGLARQPSGDVDVRVDGRHVGRVIAPWARDAQDQEVPVTMSVEGNDLILGVAHRAADVAYPVLVDPIYENWFQNGSTAWYHGNRTGLDKWAYYENPAGWYPHDTRCVGGIDCFGSGNGLFMYTYGGLGYSQAAGHYAEWIYRVYGWDTRTTYIPRVEFAYQHNKWYGDSANFALIDGIWNPAGSWTGYQARWQTAGEYVVVRAGDNVANPNVGAGKLAVFSTVPAGNNHPQASTAYTGGAVVFLDDAEYPTLTQFSHSAQPPTDRWVRDFTDTVSIAARDPGLGITAFNFYSNSAAHTSWQPTVDGQQTICYGVHASPCLGDRSSWHTYTAAALGTGAHQLTACAYDAAGKVACVPHWTARVDRTNPTVSLSGDLWNQRANLLPVRDYSLGIATQDAHSGGSRVRVMVDGISRIDSGERVCGGICDDPVTISQAWLTPGRNGYHTVEVTVWDVVGNSTTTSLYLTYEDPRSGCYSSTYFGGGDGYINTDNDANVLGSALSTRSDFQSIWNGLCTDDKNFMLEHEDSSYFVWVARIDKVGPGPAQSLTITDANNAARTAAISWTEGGDPDIEPNVPGTGVDEHFSAYRYRRAGGTWTAWYFVTESGFVLNAADPGDVVDVEVLSRDRGGRPATSSATRQFTIPVGPTAKIAAAPAALACVAYCPAGLSGAQAGAVALGAAVIGGFSWGVRKFAENADVKVKEAPPQPQAFEDYESAKKQRRKDLRKDGLDKGEIQNGEEAHHIVAVGHPLAEEARRIMWRCGMDLNNFTHNGVGVERKKHRRMHTRAYYDAINDALGRYDPDKYLTPCNPWDNPLKEGIGKALRDIAVKIKNGTFPG